MISGDLMLVVSHSIIHSVAIGYRALVQAVSGVDSECSSSEKSHSPSL